MNDRVIHQQVDPLFVHQGQSARLAAFGLQDRTKTFSHQTIARVHIGVPDTGRKRRDLPPVLSQPDEGIIAWAPIIWSQDGHIPGLGIGYSFH